MFRCSVLIPAFNVEPFVAKAIDSALAQTLPDIEVIVVNDGSTDRTSEILRGYEDRIIYIEQNNQGLSAARNRALAAARGEYIALLDADDYWMPQRLKTIVDYMDANPHLGFVTGDAYIVEEDVEIFETYYGRAATSQKFQAQNQLDSIIRANFIFIMTVLRRNLLETHGGFDARFLTCQDWDLWIRLIAAGVEVGFVEEPLAYYRLRKGSLSSERLATVKEELEVLEKAFGLPVVAALKGIQGRLHLAQGKAAMLDSDTRKAARHFASAARDRGLDMKTRARAGLAALFPGLTWRGYRGLLKSRGQLTVDSAVPPEPNSDR